MLAAVELLSLEVPMASIRASVGLPRKSVMQRRRRLAAFRENPKQAVAFARNAPPRFHALRSSRLGTPKNTFHVSSGRKNFHPYPRPCPTPPATIAANVKTIATFQSGEVVQVFPVHGGNPRPACLPAGAQVRLVRQIYAYWIVERAGREWQVFMANVHPRRTGR